MTIPSMLRAFTALLALLAAIQAIPAAAQTQPVAIPLPEHPRPDFQRPEWLNLNGTWDFQFETAGGGEAAGWHRNGLPNPQHITVPFPWGSELSGVRDEGDIGWYTRTLQVPSAWRGHRVFLTIGASDWRTTAWLDGQLLGTHQGGYTPFSFELTPHLNAGQSQRLVIRVDDTPHAFKLEGKQGYGEAKGIWQTPYVEVRGASALRAVHFTPDIDAGTVTVKARLLEPAPRPLRFALNFKDDSVAVVMRDWPQGADSLSFTIPVPNARLWSLDDPYLYDVEAIVAAPNHPKDLVNTYFGMWKISVETLPGSDARYVALNNKPVYLQLALDQAYHPEGFYTFPSDEFVRNEILMARQIGLNGLREHVKIETPRKLYWADRLGMLIMADVPNAWGEPTDTMRAEIEHAFREMVERDYNHPSIFSWVPFNETWGLVSGPEGNRQYLPETQRWVASVYRLGRAMDPTRLTEDNSVCCGRGHTETDLNSWHAYLPGWQWDAYLDSVSAGTYPGSGWNYESGYTHADQPNINSEFGNVWGYEGSTGDVDWSWDYHRAVDAFRRHPKVAGWLYTEHHDVINEWNGCWRFDRSEKFTGMDELVEGMTLGDLHSPLYVAIGQNLSRAARPGETVQLPLWASFLTDKPYGETLTLRTELYGWNSMGERKEYGETAQAVPYRPWMSEAIDPLTVTLPNEPSVAVLALRLEDAAGNVLHRNFTTFIVEGEAPTEVRLAGGERARLVSFDPARFSNVSWTQKQWNVLDGLKVNGAGSGFFEYRVRLPEGVRPEDVASATLLVEASAKQLYGKDRDNAGEQQGDYMRGQGTFDPSLNPNAYPMTDETPTPSAVTVRINGHPAGLYDLPDDPADHRGILSWHSQLQDRRLREAGSYGYLLRIPVPTEALQSAASTGELVVRMEVDSALPGGLALYGRRFGRYPLDPTLVFVMKP